MSQRFAGKVVVVTGGSSGLGRGIADRFTAEGASVVIADIEDADISPGSAMSFVRHDVTSESSWEDLIRQVLDRHGSLDVLVNNAGITGPVEISNPETTRLEDWQRVQSVNVEGVMLGCRAAIPAMATSGGSIINMSSIASINPAPESLAYGASKATVRHLTRSVAVYCGQQGYRIRCNSVHPGVVLTPLFLGAAEKLAERQGISVDAVIEGYRARSLTGELQTVDDIASAVLFLSSNEASQITGVQLVVDGGMTV